jgi:hypothetical protein
MGVSLNNLLRYQEHPAFLDSFVAGDETWVYHITPETKTEIHDVETPIISYRKKNSRRQHLSAKSWRLCFGT